MTNNATRSAMIVRTSVKAGGVVVTNHSQTAPAVVVRTGVKAGGYNPSGNHALALLA
jgi:hypothetical protein